MDQTNWQPAIAATLAMVLMSMDLFMMPIATPALEDSFDTDAAMVQAAIAGFSLVFASLCILGGKLGDVLGKKKAFRAGLVLYGIAALIVTVAPSMSMVIVGFSIVRAVGVALAIPASVALIIANYDDEVARGHAFAIYGLGATAAGLIAPLLMGFMAETISWRVPFGLEVAIAGIAFVMARAMRETPTVSSKIDGVGTVLAFLSIAAVVLAGMLGGSYGWWEARRPFEVGGTAVNPLGLSPAAPLAAFGVLIGVVLLAHNRRSEARGGEPLFSMTLFDNSTYGITLAFAVIFFVLNGALPFIVPVFLQEGLAFESATAGIVMAIFMVGSMMASLASGRLVHRMQPRLLMQLALLLIITGFVWLFARSAPGMTAFDAAASMFVVGLGFGTVFTQLPNVQLSTVPAELQGGASGLAETSKGIGVGLGTAVVGSMMLGLALGAMVDRVATQTSVVLSAQERSELIVQIEDEAVPEDVERFVAENVPNLQEIITAGYVDGFRATLGALVAWVLLALFVASFIPRVETETAEARQRMAAQDTRAGGLPLLPPQDESVT